MESGAESVVESVGGVEGGVGVESGVESGSSPNRELLVIRFDSGSGFPKHGKTVILFLGINKIARPQPQLEYVATGSR